MEYEQLRIVENGYIAPCPYRNDCTAYRVGCGGRCYWCGMFDKKKEEQKGALNDN